MIDSGSSASALLAAPRDLPSGAWLLLFLLTSAMAISFADRYVLAMLVQPIKAELGVSDTAMGIATGFAFSAFYSVFAVVMARIVDMRGGRGVILLSLLSWSALTALSGAVQNVWQLFLVRFGVGIGEAGVSPASHSILARVFPPERRSLPLALLSAGGPVGIIIAMIACGWLEQRVGWRLTFVVMGIPGLVVAGALFLARHRLPAEFAAPPEESREAERGRVLLTLLRSLVFMSISFGIAGLVFLAFGQGQWMPAFFERSFGMTRSELGLGLALTQGIGMVIGIVVGGFLGDVVARYGPDKRAYFVLASALIAGPLAISVFLVEGSSLALALAGISSIFITLPTGPFLALMQDSLTNSVRATGIATSSLISIVVGLGLGPFVIGLVSDLLGPTYGVESLRQALLISVSVGAALWIIPLSIVAIAYSRKDDRAVGLIR